MWEILVNPQFTDEKRCQVVMLLVPEENEKRVLTPGGSQILQFLLEGRTP